MESQADLDAALANYERAYKEKKEREASQPPPPPEPVKVIQLPLFNREAPPAPNAVLRSSLFPAIHSKDRQFINNELVASVDGINVKLKGEQLNQDDLDVLLCVENLAREHPDTLTCQVSERGLLKLLGRQSGKTNEAALNESLVRLGGMITVKMGKFEYTGGFVHHIYKDDQTKRYVIQLNPRLGALLRSGWTALNIETRQKLSGKPLALWLQAFYATHETPYPYKVETLRELSGSRTAELYHFRANLRRALDDWTATGDIQSWQIDPETDLVQITRHGKPKPKKIARKSTKQAPLSSDDGSTFQPLKPPFSR